MSRLRSSSLCVGIALSGALALAGCASTTGLAWVAEAHHGESRVIDSSSSRDVAIPATADPEPEADVRPRLNHTVTLGEIDVAPVELAAPGAGNGNGPSVTINNYNVMNGATPTYGYGYLSPAYGRSFSAGNAQRSSASPQPLTPGQSWPTISDPGPSFPYRAGPASPWARTQ